MPEFRFYKTYLLLAPLLTFPVTILNRQRNKDKESGVSRGIDFQFVSNIINFDFPLNVDSYIHRVGRTARGTNQGTALSLVAKADEDRFKEVETRLRALMPDTGPVFKDFKFDITQLDGFR